MGLVASSCCALSACWCCVSSIPCCCGMVLSITKSVATRVTYTVVFFTVALLAWLILLYGQSDLPHIPFIEPSDPAIRGIVATYRITFALFTYHLVLSLLLIGVDNGKSVRAKINDGWWPVKLGFLMILLIADFFIPYEFFTYYAWVAVFGAGVFMLIQLVLLVDFAYSWSESWVDKWQQGEAENKIYYYALLAATGFLFLVALGFTGFNYGMFCRGDCWWNAIIITCVFIMCLFLTVCSIIPKIQEFNPRVGLLQAAIFSVYCSYYVYSGILSEPTCGAFPFLSSSDGTTATEPSTFQEVTQWIALIFGALFTVISVVYASVRAGTSSEAFFTSGTVSEVAASPEDAEEAQLAKEELEEDLRDDEKEQCAYNYSMFHLAFALGAMNVCMLLTNWSVVSGVNDAAATDSGWVSVTVKILSCFLAGGLYLWTMFAPAILPNRDWDL